MGAGREINILKKRGEKERYKQQQENRKKKYKDYRDKPFQSAIWVRIVKHL